MARPVWQKSVATLVLFLGLAGLSLWIGGGALLSGLGYSLLPYRLGMLRISQPIAFPVHMLTGGLGLMLAVAAIGVRPHRSWHLLFGRLAGIALAVASLSAVPVALASLAHPFARLGFLVQGIACLVCLGAGFRAIRHGRVEQHFRMMLCAAAIAFGAVVLRLALLGADALGLPLEATYTAFAWLAWLVPVAVYEGWRRWSMARPLAD